MKLRNITSFAALFLVLMLALASCRSSKRGMKEQEDKTQPTITITTPAEKEKKQQEEKQGAVAGTNFTARVRVTVTQGDKNVTTNGALRMRYDEVIQITLVDPLLGVAEVGRLEISPDNILVIDRINRRYVSASYDEFAALINKICKVSDEAGVNFTFTVSEDQDKLPEALFANAKVI